MHATTHTHTHTHTHCKQSKRQVSSPRRPHAAPPSTVERVFAGAAGQNGKTAAPPANARPSPRVAGRTQPSIHAASGEKSPPAHGPTGARTDVSLLHALHSSPLDTPASTSVRRLDDGRSDPPLRVQRLRPLRQRSSSAHPDAHDRNPAMQGLDTAAPPPCSRRHRAHPNARHPRPPDPGPRRRSSGGVRPPGTV